MPTWQAGNYRLYQYAGRTSGILYVIRIEEAGGVNALHAYFTTADSFPANFVTGAIYLLYFPVSMFQPMMEMLREEKPVWVHALDVNNTYIGTHEEPIGEDEGA